MRGNMAMYVQSRSVYRYVDVRTYPYTSLIFENPGFRWSSGFLCIREHMPPTRASRARHTPWTCPIARKGETWTIGTSCPWHYATRSSEQARSIPIRWWAPSSCATAVSSPPAIMTISAVGMRNAARSKPRNATMSMCEAPLSTSRWNPAATPASSRPVRRHLSTRDWSAW